MMQRSTCFGAKRVSRAAYAGAGSLSATARPCKQRLLQVTHPVTGSGVSMSVAGSVYSVTVSSNARTSKSQGRTLNVWLIDQVLKATGFNVIHRGDTGTLTCVRFGDPARVSAADGVLQMARVSRLRLPSYPEALCCC